MWITPSGYEIQYYDYVDKNKNMHGSATKVEQLFLKEFANFTCIKS